MSKKKKGITLSTFIGIIILIALFTNFDKVAKTTQDKFVDVTNSVKTSAENSINNANKQTPETTPTPTPSPIPQ